MPELLAVRLPQLVPGPERQGRTARYSSGSGHQGTGTLQPCLEENCPKMATDVEGEVPPSSPHPAAENALCMCQQHRLMEPGLM